MNQVNHYESVMLYRGPHDGAYLRIDPSEIHLIWEAELYSRIPGEQQHILVHVHSALTQIIKEQGCDLHECYMDFIKWFRQTKKDKIQQQIADAPMHIDLIALFNSIVAMGMSLESFFPELNSKK